MDVPDLDEMVVGAGEGETVGLIDGESVDGRVAMARKHLKELERLEAAIKTKHTLIRLMNTSGEIAPDCMSLRSRFCRIELSMLRVTRTKRRGTKQGAVWWGFGSLERIQCGESRFESPPIAFSSLQNDSVSPLGQTGQSIKRRSDAKTTKSGGSSLY